MLFRRRRGGFSRRRRTGRGRRRYRRRGRRCYGDRGGGRRSLWLLRRRLFARQRQDRVTARIGGRARGLDRLAVGFRFGRIHFGRVLGGGFLDHRLFGDALGLDAR